MEPTILHDGRKVQAAECETLETALGTAPPRRFPGQRVTIPTVCEIRGGWVIVCLCCPGGSGEHTWSPSGYGVDPDGGHYSCGPCGGTGEFKIVMP